MGVGSGGVRANAGRLRVPVRRFCAHCRRPFVAYRRARRWCDLHQSPRLRADDPMPEVLRQALAQLEAFGRQFEGDAAIADVGRRALAELAQLASPECSRGRFE